MLNDSVHAFVVRDTRRRARIEEWGRRASSRSFRTSEEKASWCDRSAEGVGSLVLFTNNSKLDVDEA